MKKQSFKEHLVYCYPSHQLMAASRSLLPILKAPDKFGTKRYQEEGRIDVRRVHRALNGHRDFRKQVWTQEGFTTAVGLVIDLSLSMDSLICAAQAAARAILRTVEVCGNPSICWGFTDGGKMWRQYGDMLGFTKAGWYGDRTFEYSFNKRAGIDNWTNANLQAEAEKKDAQLIQIKGPNETVAMANDALAACVPELCKSNTPCSPAIIGCADLLSQLKADRHILMVLTDGACGFGKDYVKDATKYANEVGVETVGIALSSVNQSDPNYIREGDYNAYDIAKVQPVKKFRNDNDPKRHQIVKEADPLGAQFFASLVRQLGRGQTSKAVRTI